MPYPLLKILKNKKLHQEYKCSSNPTSASFSISCVLLLWTSELPNSTSDLAVMAIINNLREIKDWLSEMRPSKPPEWETDLLLRSVPARPPRSVIPVLPTSSASLNTHGQPANALRHASNDASILLLDPQNCPVGSTTRNRASGDGPSSFHASHTSAPQNLHSHTAKSQTVQGSGASYLSANSTTFGQAKTHNSMYVDDPGAGSPYFSNAAKSQPVKVNVASKANDSKRPLLASSCLSASLLSQSTHENSRKESFSIIDPSKLGLTSMLESSMPAAKRAKVSGVNSIPSPIDTNTPLVKSGHLSSHIGNLTNLSIFGLNNKRARALAFSSPVNSQSHSSDTDVPSLQNYIRLCEAKIELLIKRNAINDSTSLSLDAKTQWIKEKFEPRMQEITSQIDLTRINFTFLNPPIDEHNLLNITSDADAIQIEQTQRTLYDSSTVLLGSNASNQNFETLAERSSKYDVVVVGNAPEDITSVILSPVIQQSAQDYTSNILEARRVVAENKARTGNRNSYKDDEDEEDDFGADYLGGLVSSQLSNNTTDLSGFVVSDEEGSRLHQQNSCDNTYLGTQGTQLDSDNDTDGVENSDVEAPEPIQNELQDLLSDDEIKDSYRSEPVAIEISDDDEEIVSADFTTQLNENRDEIIHIPSEDELDDDDLNDLRELLHVKLEQSQRVASQVLSDSDFSDDDDELLQLTKTVLPSRVPTNTIQPTDFRVIPGSEPFIDEIYAILKKTFGLQSFRPNQLEAVVASLLGKDVFVLLPTGGGKSLCFQLPALVKGGKTCGVTVVVSPLISLMQDQVQHLQEKHIRAGMISSKGTQEERNQAIKSLTTGQFDLVYLSPEMINNSGRIQKILIKLHENEMLARVVVDEAHCVSSWGHDFRPDYKGMNFFKQNFPNLPIMALTATASEKVRLDIIHNLQMKDPVMLKQSFNRTNLFYTVMNKPPSIYEWIRKYVTEKHRGETGIIYCHSKQSCETTAEKLNECGISCMYYHAGMDAEERLDVQLKWQQNRVQLICATIAFGMGIDKPDVRFVIHIYIPRTLEGYYQETGRAGRDGNESDCVMFYSYKDARALQSLILRDQNLEERAREVHLSKLRQVVQYCENKTDCRRRQVLHFFNESFDAKDCLKKCDNCCKNIVSVTKDITNHCINIIKMVMEIQKDKVTVLHCQDVFKGSRNRKITALKHHETKFFGIGKNLDKGDIERMFFELQSLNGISEYQVMRGGFASSYVQLGTEANLFLNGGKRVSLLFAQKDNSASNETRLTPRLNATGNGQGLDNFRYTDSFVSARDYRLQEEQEKENMQSSSWMSKTTTHLSVNVGHSTAYTRALDELTNLRKQLLLEKGFAHPNYYLSDALLNEMAQKLPTNAKDFGKLSNFDKTQSSQFIDFKKLLGSLARSRKGGSSQATSRSVGEPSYSQQSRVRRLSKGFGRGYSKSSQGSKGRGFSSRQRQPTSTRKEQGSGHARQMPI